jgi:serine O-acetyltransferase
MDAARLCSCATDRSPELTMLSRYLALFDVERCRNASSLLELVISDYMAFYGAWGGPQYKMRSGMDQPLEPEPRRRLALLFLPRLINNPSLHAALLLRLASRSPRLLFGFWRTVLIAKHSIDTQPGNEFGPGLVLPHPVGIVLGAGVKFGRGVAIAHSVSIGGAPGYTADAPQLCPVIGDGVVIWTQSIVIGPISIGDGAVIGARSWVDKDVPPGGVTTSKPKRAAAS